MEYIELRGHRALDRLADIAAVRTRVFAEWPYIYDGDLEHEKRYLSSYFESENSFIVLAADAGQVVGASTAVWLPDADEAFRAPFKGGRYDLSKICYYGESVLLPSYRGRGIGKEFMRRRESFARSLPGVTHCAFCAVVRPDEHPRRDSAYRPLDPFWSDAGFAPIAGMHARFKWKDLGDIEETEKRLRFWLKAL
jgi:GNAT superfamily N-acetyltransferase